MSQDKIWDSYQNDEEFLEHGCPGGGRLEYMANQVRKNEKVLTIGVGRAELEALLVVKGVDICCLDPSARSIDRIKQQLSLGDKAKVGYSQDIPFLDEKFDCVVMTEVLEHLSDKVLAQTLSEVHRVLKSGGRFIGTVPADEDLRSSFVICPHCGENFHRWGHMQSFSQQRLGECFEGVFDRYTVLRTVFGDLAKLNWKGKISLLVRKLFALSGKKGSNQNFYFEAYKA